MPNYHRQNGVEVDVEGLAEGWVRYPQKALWFAKHGWTPHYWQQLFHLATNPDNERASRFRHLVAGRRGGKTLSAAWECIFYMLHPEAYHMDFHGKYLDRPLVGWIVTKDYPMGLWSLIAIREVLKQAGLEPGRDYKEHRGNRWFEFSNGSFLLFKTADNPESLRGAGLDWMWFDEAAIIPDERAWQVASPALANLEGAFVSTTTPDGKNWFYTQFWSPELMKAPDHSRVEYYSLDNPYFPKKEWDRLQREYHPLMFRREFMASFDAMAGKELDGDWLKYYEWPDIEHLRKPGNTWDMQIYVAVDPAISLADTADRFAISVIGITKDRSQAYLLDQWAGRIPFTDQITKIGEFYQRWKPHYIGIEKTAYQAALVQEVQKLPGMPPVVALWTKGKKFQRILGMSPLFRVGKILIRKEHIDFIDEWINYDSELKNPKDDCLDSVQMALQMAGILIPGLPDVPEEPDWSGAAVTASMWTEVAARHRPGREKGYDEHLGADW